MGVKVCERACVYGAFIPSDSGIRFEVSLTNLLCFKDQSETPFLRSKSILFPVNVKV